MLALMEPQGTASEGLGVAGNDAVRERLTEVCQAISEKLPGVQFDIALCSGRGSADLAHWARSADDPPGDREHQIGCLQHSLCGAVLWALASESLIDPDSLVGDYLPELKNGGHGPGDLVRVVDLVRHSSGYLSSPALGWDELVDYLLRTGASFPSGQVINYYGPEQRILTRLIEAVTGNSPWNEVESRIYKPLDIGLRFGAPGKYNLGYGKVIGSTKCLLKVFQFIRSADGPWGDAFLRDLRRDIIHAARSKHAATTRLPTGYSWGFSHFENGLWGGSGFSGSDGLGLRFDEGGDFMVTAAVAGIQFRRDLFLEEFCAAYGFRSAETGKRLPLGAVIGLDPGALPGIYRSGPDRSIQVFVDGFHLDCAIMNNGQIGGSMRGFIRSDGTIMGDSRWPGTRIQFFPHPLTGQPSMSFGLTAYVRADA